MNTAPTLFFIVAYKRLNKLEFNFLIMLGCEGLTVTNTLAYWANFQVMMNIKCCESQGPYLQHIIFFVTYKWVLSVLDYTRLERIDRDRHSSLLDLFVNYERKKCCE